MMISFEKLFEEHNEDLTEKDLENVLKNNLDETSKTAYWFLAAIFPITGIYFTVNEKLAGEIGIQLLLAVAMLAFIGSYFIFIKIIGEQNTKNYIEYLDYRNRLKEMNKK